MRYMLVPLALLSFIAGGCAMEGTFAAKSPSFDDSSEVGGLRSPAAAATEALAVPAVGEIPARKPGAARDVVYSGAFRVVVANVPGTLEELRAVADDLGGYMQEIAGGAITLRVPAPKFEEAVAFIEGVGEVVDRQLKAQDVTEELHDLRARIDNQEKLRQRFQELLAKAEKVEDALKIETELARVTEELDKAKGKLRYLESQVAMSTLRVELNAASPTRPGGSGPRLPFDWVGELGEGLVEGQVKQTVRTPGIFGRGPRFKPPTGFVRYYEDDAQIEAMNADGLRLRVLRRDNVDKAPLTFWSTLVRKSLVTGRALSVSDEETGKDFHILRGSRNVGGKNLGYLLLLKRSDRRVVAFEAWGDKKQVDETFDALRTSALSVDAG